MTDPEGPDVQPCGEAIFLMHQATDEMLAGSRELKSGMAGGWRAATRFRKSEQLLRLAADRMKDAAIGVWPLPVYERPNAGR